MDTKTMAEKIVREISYGYADTELRGVSLGNVAWVASQLDKAVREAYEDGIGDSKTIDAAYDQGFTYGFCAARGKAAGIADDLEKLHANYTSSWEEGFLDCAAIANQRIRTMMPSEK